MRKTFLPGKTLMRLAVLALVAVLIAACGQTKPTTPAPATDNQPAGTEQPPQVSATEPPAEKPPLAKVRYRFDWLPRGNYAPLFIAREKGYFADENLEVQIDNGNGSGNATKLVGSGEYEFGQSDSLTMAVGKSKGAKVKAVFMMNQKSPLAWVALAETGLKTPADVEGKKFGLNPGGSNLPFFRSMAKVNNVDVSKVEEVTIGVPYEQYLLQKQVDIVVGYVDAELPALAEHVGGMENLNVLLGSEHGMNMYGTTVIANEDFLAEQPDVASRFLRAYARAWADMINNPDEAVEILVKHNPDMPAALAREQLAADIEYTFHSDVVTEHGWGWMTEETWATTQDLAVTGGMMESAMPVDSLFSNDFLPKE